MAITPRQYERLSKQGADIGRFLKEAGWRFRYYRGELPLKSTPPVKDK